MKNLWQILSSVLIAIPPSTQLTYWVDDSCRTGQMGPKIDVAIREGIDMALRGSQRLADDNDVNQHDNYQKLFKVPSNSAMERGQVDSSHSGPFAEYATLLTVHKPDVLGPSPDGIGTAQPVPHGDRIRSNIRIYCDEDVQNLNGGSRWTLADDPPQPWPPGQVWVDKTNEVGTLGLGCQARSGPQNIKPQAVTHHARLVSSQIPNQAQDRAVVTLCNQQIELSERKDSLDEIPTRRNLEGAMMRQGNRKMISALQILTSFVLFHEFCHCRPFRKIDVPVPNTDPERKAYGWRDLLSLDTTASLLNVNNYAYFVLLAKLADRGYRLSRSNNAAWRTHGTLVYDNTIKVMPNKRSIEGGQLCSETVQRKNMTCRELRA